MLESQPKEDQEISIISVIAGEGDENEYCFDISDHSTLKVVVHEPGEDSYVEQVLTDGSTRRIFTKRNGGPIRIRTDRV